jgi:hypothetical protein
LARPAGRCRFLGYFELRDLDATVDATQDLRHLGVTDFMLGFERVEAIEALREKSTGIVGALRSAG